MIYTIRVWQLPLCPHRPRPSPFLLVILICIIIFFIIFPPAPYSLPCPCSFLLYSSSSSVRLCHPLHPSHSFKVYLPCESE